MGARWFGASVQRKEDPALLQGRGRYIDDLSLPGMLHACFVRSTVAHARIAGIEVGAARRAPGVQTVLSFADLPEQLRSRPIPLLVPSPALSQPLMPHALAHREVRYVGEIIAMVVADTRATAEDAASLVEVDYEVLPAVPDCLTARQEAGPRAHAGSPSNVAGHFPIAVGDTDRAFASAAHIFRENIFQHRGGAFFMECRGAIASWDQTLQSLSFFVSSQGSHRHKQTIAEMFDLGEPQLRVVTPDVGGGFGPKGSFYPEYAALIAASMQLGRAVKWIEDRRENFLATHQERDQDWDVEIAVTGDGRILGVRGTMIHDMGAYTPWGVVLPWIAGSTVPGPYVIPSYRLEVTCLLTNKVPTTPVRGAGRPQAVVVMERLMDRVASELGLDAAEVRLRNFIQPDQMPYKVGIIFRDGRPVTYDSGDYPACQAAALRAIDYEGFPERRRIAEREGRRLGIGIGNAVEGTGLGPYEGATVRVGTDGRIVVYTGATPQGQSHKTTLAQIAADQLGVDFNRVEIVTGDTAGISLGVGSFGARTAVNAGSSVHLAAVAVAEKIKRLAGEMLEVSAADIELKDGVASVLGVAQMKKSFRELAIRAAGVPGFSMAGGLDPGLEHTAYFTPDQSTYANGTTVCEVGVDVETGHVTIERLVIAHDCGRVINPMVVDGQVVGGVVHAIGNALMERIVFDEDAQPLTTNFGEYLLPLATDVPRVEIIHMETPSPLNPLGIKGAGEGGTIPTIAAILNAVNNALAPLGVVLREVPILPHRVLEAVNEATQRAAT
jgi:aerobic carbon-monoxide dehydrogenase large subunit